MVKVSDVDICFYDIHYFCQRKNCTMSTRFTINTKPTTNEKIFKFEANAFLVQGSSYEFANIDQAKPCPLAQELFHLPFVKTIFLAQNFIAIEKYDIVEWDQILEQLSEAIENYLNSGRELITKAKNTGSNATIYAESTPNPNTMKFVANRTLVPRRFEYNTIDQTQYAPLAKVLFQELGVQEVFMHQNYVSITKGDEISWEQLINPLKKRIQEFMNSGEPILLDHALSEPEQTNSINTPVPLIQRSDQDKEIISLLEEFVTPAVAGDGGYIAFDSFDPETKTVRVLLQGACSGCPSSTITLKNGIESLLKEMTQGRVAQVEAING